MKTCFILCLLVWVLGIHAYAEHSPIDSLRQLWQTTDTPIQQWESLRKLVIHFQWEKQLDSVTVYVEKLEALTQEMKDPVLRNRHQYLKGNLAFSRGDIMAAVAELRQAEQLCRQSGDTLTLAYVQNSLAFLLGYLKEFEQAIKMTREALGVANNLSDSMLQALSYNTLAAIAHLENAYPSQIQYADSALTYFPNTSMDSIALPGRKGLYYQMGIKMNRAVGYMHLPGKQKLAINSLQEILNAAKEYDIPEVEAKIMGNLIMAYTNNGDVQQAIVMAKKVLVINQERNMTQDEMMTRINLGTMLNDEFQIRQFEEAKLHLEAGLQLADSLGSPAHALLARLHLVQNYILTHDGKCGNLSDELLQLLETARKTNYPSGLNLALILAGECYYVEDSYEKARLHYEEALTNMQEGAQMHQIDRVHDRLYQIAKEQGDYEQALKHFEARADLRDSVRTVENNRNLEQIKIEYETEGYKQQMEAEQQVNTLLRRQLIGAVAGIALIGGLAFFLFRARQRAHRDRAHIETLHAELDHRVKNNLNFLNSMVAMQSVQQQAPEAKAALSATQSRIEALVLLHKILRKEGEGSTVSLNEYLNPLIEQLRTVSGYSGQEVEIERRIAPVHIESSQAFALALILNEWLTNAFKYAVPEAENPRILVELKPIGNDQLILVVADNGPGYDPTQRREGSYGTQLVDSQVRQLRADLQAETINGTRYTLTFQTRN